MNHSGVTVLAGSGRVLVEFCQIVADGHAKRPFTDSFTDTRPPSLRNALEVYHLKMEPAVGIEPTTFALRKHCSTTELRWLQYIGNFASTRPSRQERLQNGCIDLIMGQRGKQVGGGAY